MNTISNTLTVSREQMKHIYGTLKDLAASCQEQEDGMPDRVWLARQYQRFLPGLSDKEAAGLSAATLDGVSRFDSILKEAAASASSGQGMEQWFAEKMRPELEKFDINEAGACIKALDTALLYGNQYMAESEPVSAGHEELSVIIPEIIEEEDTSQDQWNPFTVKEVLTHLGQGAALMGLQTMNQPGVLDFTAESIIDETDNLSALRSLVESGDTKQVKALLTAALKIGCDTQTLPYLSNAASVDVIAGIASHGVEYALTLTRFSAGELSLMQAMNHMGLSGVSLLYSICSTAGIRGVSTLLLSQIPFVGPVLGTFVGGMISVTLGKAFHEKVRDTVKKAEHTVRSAVHSAWTKVKSVGKSIAGKVKSFCSRLFA